MKSSIEKLAHWLSISSMAGAVGMVCAGHTILAPALHTGGDWVSLLYWSGCAALAVSTAAFAYLALSSARQQLRAKPATASQPPPPSEVTVRFSLVTGEHAEV